MTAVQQSLQPPILDSQTAPTPQPHQEVTYTGQCLGQPCFDVNEDAEYGVCKELGIKIYMPLAKRQMLCDHESTAYHTQHLKKYTATDKTEAAKPPSKAKRTEKP